MGEQGLLHIYCGDGKGKTTAAVGLAVRAAGCKKRVLFARFLKNEHSGELAAMEQVEGIDVLHLEKSFGFYGTLSREEQKEMRRFFEEVWNRVREKAAGGDYDLLVMDEFAAAYRYGIIPGREALSFLRNRPEKLEVVLTGRDPAPELLELADYVSEIRKVKHPYDRGIPARRGIEY